MAAATGQVQMLDVSVLGPYQLNTIECNLEGREKELALVPVPSFELSHSTKQNLTFRIKSHKKHLNYI
ncbi:hypothetical protein SLEP1_g45375 [Rubroshorea leprosula]|uniref:Uncharacterized protein n=1 Tax=Rubroshorea leprosula TaxID=152421 RepID=A0AAV5LJM7_9ROSI|nr:hypothetical protein SLEP1_g45375 [Rubroshorea leprosula]